MELHAGLREAGLLVDVKRLYDEALTSTFSYLDMTALGRREAWEDSPEGYPQAPRAERPTVGWRNWGPYQWWNLHDEYEPPPSTS